MAARAIAEAVRTPPGPRSHAVEIASEAGVLDAASRRVWKNLGRLGPPIVGIWIGSVGVGHVRLCIKIRDCCRYTPVYSHLYPSRMLSPGRSVTPHALLVCILEPPPQARPSVNTARFKDPLAYNPILRRFSTAAEREGMRPNSRHGDGCRSRAAA